MPKPNEPETSADDLLANVPDVADPAPEIAAGEDGGRVAAIAAAVRGESDAPETSADEPPVTEPVVEPPAADEPPAAEPAKDEEHDKAVTAEMAQLGITKPDSQARFRELANKAKTVDEVTTERDQIREAYQRQAEVFDHFDKAGVTGEQFGTMIAIAGDINSRDPVRMKRAHDVLTLELQAVAKTLGLETVGFDPLTAHPDLLARVQDASLDRTDALEIVRLRSQHQLAEKSQATQRERDAYAVEVQAGQRALDNLEATLKARDPAYSHKAAIAIAILKPQIEAGTLPASKWAETFASVYAGIPAPVAAAPTAPARRPDPNNPARPNGAAAGPREPKNAAEAVALAMGRSLD